jgi:hypothetical protein
LSANLSLHPEIDNIAATVRMDVLKKLFFMFQKMMDDELHN